MVKPLFFASLNSFYTAYQDSDFFGKLIFLGLILLSVICWCMLTYKIWLLKKVKKNAKNFQGTLSTSQQSLLQFTVPKEQGEFSTSLNPFAVILSSIQKKTTELLHKNRFFIQKSQKEAEVYLSQADLELIESHVLTTISIQSKLLERNLFILTMIVTLAPFLGLLGTVWGILTTFSGLQAGGSIGSNNMILGGLATALTTTVLGLVIAIPALVSYSYLKNVAKTLSSDMEDFLYILLSTLELQYRKVE